MDTQKDPSSSINWKNPFDVLFTVIAFFWFLGSKARQRAYGSGKIPFWVNGSVGFGVDFAAAIATARYVGWVQNHSFFVWLPAAIGAFIVVGAFLWPFAYVLGDAVSDLVTRLARTALKRSVLALANALISLPGAKANWDKVEDKKRESWFGELRSGVWFLIALSASLHLSWQAGVCAYGLATSVGFTWLGLAVVAGGFAAVATFGAVFSIFFELLSDTDYRGMAVATAAAIGYLAVIVLGWFGLSLGIVGSLVLGILVFIGYAAYAFPLVDLFFTDVLKKFWDVWKPVLEETYDNKTADNPGNSRNLSDFRLLWSHFVSLVATVALTWLAVWVAGVAGLHTVFVVVVGAIVGVTSFFNMVDLFRNRWGNIVLGILLTLGVAAWTCFDWYYGGGSLTWMGMHVIVGALAGAATAVVALPLVYIGAARLLDGRTNGAGKVVDDFHTNLDKKFTFVREKFNQWKNEAYSTYKKEDNGFRRLSSQLLVLVLTLGLGYLVATYGGFWFKVLGLLTAVVAYLIAGKVAEKQEATSRFANALAIVAAIWAAGSVFATVTWSLVPALLVAMAAASFVGYVVYKLLFAPLYLLAKAGTEKVVAEETLDKGAAALAGLHAKAFDLFDSFVWQHLKGIVTAVATFMEPYYKAVSESWRKIMKAIEDRFGTKKETTPPPALHDVKPADDTTSGVVPPTTTVEPDGNDVSMKRVEGDVKLPEPVGDGLTAVVNKLDGNADANKLVAPTVTDSVVPPTTTDSAPPTSGN